MTTKVRRVGAELRLSIRILDAAREAAAACGITVDEWIESAVDTVLAERRCRHKGPTPRAGDDPDAGPEEAA